MNTEVFTIGSLHARSVLAEIFRHLPTREMDQLILEKIQEVVLNFSGTFLNTVKGISKVIWCYNYEKLISVCSQYDLLADLYRNYSEMELTTDRQNAPIVILYNQEQKIFIIGIGLLQ